MNDGMMVISIVICECGEWFTETHLDLDKSDKYCPKCERKKKIEKIIENILDN